MHLTSPEKNSHAHSDMPKSVHMHVKNFTYIASIMHVKFEIHMHDKIVHMSGKISHVINCMEKKFTHMTKIFHTYYKISHACQKVHMHVKC